MIHKSYRKLRVALAARRKCSAPRLGGSKREPARSAALASSKVEQILLCDGAIVRVILGFERKKQEKAVYDTDSELLCARDRGDA